MCQNPVSAPLLLTGVWLCLDAGLDALGNGCQGVALECIPNLQQAREGHTTHTDTSSISSWSRGCDRDTCTWPLGVCVLEHCAGYPLFEWHAILVLEVRQRASQHAAQPQVCLRLTGAQSVSESLTVCRVSGPGALAPSTVTASTAAMTTPNRMPPAGTTRQCTPHVCEAATATVRQDGCGHSHKPAGVHCLLL